MTYYILACVGLTFIIKYGSILNWIRSPLLKFKIFKEFFSCSLCIGFWSGVYVGLLAVFIEDKIIYSFMPLVSACVSWSVDIFLGVLISLQLFLDNKNK